MYNSTFHNIAYNIHSNLNFGSCIGLKMEQSITKLVQYFFLPKNEKKIREPFLLLGSTPIDPKCETESI